MLLFFYMRPVARRTLIGGVVITAIAGVFITGRSSSEIKMKERLESLPKFAEAFALAVAGSPRAAESRAGLDESSAERLRMWQSGLRMLTDHPFGIGLSNVGRVYPLYRMPDSIHPNEGHLHNNFLQIAVERGVVGLAAFVTIFVLFVPRALAVTRSFPGWTDAVGAFSLAAVAAFLVAGLSEYDFGDSKVAMAMWFIVALGANGAPKHG